MKEVVGPKADADHRLGQAKYFSLMLEVINADKTITNAERSFIRAQLEEDYPGLFFSYRGDNIIVGNGL